jgi:hypothetical protein
MANSTGIDRESGKSLSDWPHVVQSIHLIFSTHIGSRVMRRLFGSAVPGLLGKNLVPVTMSRFFTAIILAIELWEPRFRVTQIVYPQPQNSPDTLRVGKIEFSIVGVYMPNALKGDFTPSPIPRTIKIGG